MRRPAPVPALAFSFGTLARPQTDLRPLPNSLTSEV